MLIRPSHGCWVEVATTTSILTGRPVRSSIICIRIFSATVKVIPDFRLDCFIAWADRVKQVVSFHDVISRSSTHDFKNGSGIRPRRSSPAVPSFTLHLSPYPYMPKTGGFDVAPDSLHLQALMLKINVGAAAHKWNLVSWSWSHYKIRERNSGGCFCPLHQQA